MVEKEFLCNNLLHDACGSSPRIDIIAMKNDDSIYIFEAKNAVNCQQVTAGCGQLLYYETFFNKFDGVITKILLTMGHITNEGLIRYLKKYDISSIAYNDLEKTIASFPL